MCQSLWNQSWLGKVKYDERSFNSLKTVWLSDRLSFPAGRDDLSHVGSNLLAVCNLIHSILHIHQMLFGRVITCSNWRNLISGFATHKLLFVAEMMLHSRTMCTCANADMLNLIMSSFHLSLQMVSVLPGFSGPEVERRTRVMEGIMQSWWIMFTLFGGKAKHNRSLWTAIM